MRPKIVIYFMLLLIVPVLFYALSCASSIEEIGTTTTTTTSTSTTLSGGGREYYPNANGYSWTYKRTTTSSLTTLETIFFDRTTVSGTIEVGTIEAQIVKHETLAPTVSTFETYQVVTDNYCLQLSSEVSMVLAFPLYVGASWIISDTREATVTSFEAVTVIAGTFNNCFKVHKVRAADSWVDVWYAKNVGVVKSRTYSGTNGNWVQNESELSEKSF